MKTKRYFPKLRIPRGMGRKQCALACRLVYRALRLDKRAEQLGEVVLGEAERGELRRFRKRLLAKRRRLVATGS